MGLLVAGITGGASLIENARLTSLKREVDDYIKDVFTFYAKVGRFPGDLDNSGRIGYNSGRSPYLENDFSVPYSMTDINIVSGPFIELYLYEVSSFKPKHDATSGKGITASVQRETVKTDIADHGGIPFSKIYKDFMYVHRRENNSDDNNSSSFLYGMSTKTAINIFMTEVKNVKNKKTVDIARKIDIKFDDEAHNGGNIRSSCGIETDANGFGNVSYTDAGVCTEVLFYFDGSQNIFIDNVDDDDDEKPKCDTADSYGSPAGWYGWDAELYIWSDDIYTGKLVSEGYTVEVTGCTDSNKTLTGQIKFWCTIDGDWAEWQRIDDGWCANK
jgi:hypothetical protein